MKRGGAYAHFMAKVAQHDGLVLILELPPESCRELYLLARERGLELTELGVFATQILMDGILRAKARRRAERV